MSDLGGTFGKTGGFISRSRNKPSDYVKAEFVKAVKGDLIDFNYGGKNQKLFEDLTVNGAVDCRLVKPPERRPDQGCVPRRKL